MEKIIQLQDLQPGTSYLVRARAINKFGVVSEWSQTYTLNVTNDDTKPSVPAAPTIQIAGPQKIVVSHDNTKDGGGDLEYDVASYKVFENSVDNNTTGTLIHTMSATRPGSGLDSFATVNVDVKDTDPSATRYYYVTAVDVAGNESDPSPTATGVSITFFESAYISDLTADKIKTGTLQANESISVGTLSPIIIKSNADSPRGQIYIGTGNYAQSDTAFYVDSTGKFSLKDALTWDGTTLSINGYLQVGEALETGDAADDINNNPTTIVGDKIRTGNLISNNYLSDTGSSTEQSSTFTQSGTWIDLDDGSIWSKKFFIDTDGNAVFQGNLFASRGIFSDYLTPAEGADTFNYKDPGDTSNQLRYPTLTVESTNTDDGYLVLFKNVGTDNGIEFYVKQGPETPENDQKNWRRGSLAHISDGDGGFVRLGAFPSSTGLTPGRLRIFSQDSPTGPKGEIYLDASRTYAQRLFITQPTTTGDFLTDPITNFWKDPDGVANGDKYFQVGSTIGPAVIVKKDSSGLDKVVIKDYEIEGVATILDDSKITVNTVEIGKGVGGSGKHGIRIDGSNYWYDPTPLNATDIVFRAGGSASESLTVRKNGSVEFEGTTNPTGGEIKGLLVIKDVSNNLTFEIGKNVDSGRDGIRLNANNYWTISQTAKSANFKVGGSSKYLEYNSVTDILELTGTINADAGRIGEWYLDNGNLLSQDPNAGAGVPFVNLTAGTSPQIFFGDEDSISFVVTMDGIEAGYNFGPLGSWGQANPLRILPSSGGAGFEEPAPVSSKIGLFKLENPSTIHSGIVFEDTMLYNFSLEEYTTSSASKMTMISEQIYLSGSVDIGIEGQVTPVNIYVGNGTTPVEILGKNSSGNMLWFDASSVGGGGDESPTGSIIMYGGSSSPSGWLFCDGTAVSRSTYSALFAVLGTSYGSGNGSTTFNLPDFTSRFPRQGTNRNTARGNTGGQDSFTLEESNIPSHTHGPGTLRTNLQGSHSHGPGTLATNLSGRHSHGPGTLATNLSGNHTDTNTTYTFGTNTNTAGGGSGNRLTTVTTVNSNRTISSHSHSVNSGSTDTRTSHSHIVNSGSTDNVSSHDHILDEGETGSWGSATPTSIDNKPPYLVVNFIIKT